MFNDRSVTVSIKPSRITILVRKIDQFFYMYTHSIILWSEIAIYRIFGCSRL